MIIEASIISTLTRMTTFIKAKLKKLDAQKIMYKYRVAANITEYHINLPKNHRNS